jgi:hypothetical protein
MFNVFCLLRLFGTLPDPEPVHNFEFRIRPKVLDFLRIQVHNTTGIERSCRCCSQKEINGLVCLGAAVKGNLTVLSL